VDAKGMTISRRLFLRNTRNTIAGVGSLLLTATPTLLAKTQQNQKNLIIIIARGGMDGLAAVPPRNNLELEGCRPNIFVKNPINLTSDFNLHPSLKTFETLWHNNKAAVVHATNIPYTGRSHFDGQNLMESGGHVPYQELTGWLGRGIDEAGFEGLSISLPIPLLLRGTNNSDNFFPTMMEKPSNKIMHIIADHYASDKKLKGAMDRIQARPLSMTESVMGRNKIHRDFSFLTGIAGAQMAKPNGPRVAVFEVFGFDTHAAQGGRNGLLDQKLGVIDEIFSGLRLALGDNFDNTIILTLTEFGRTLKENGGYGTDHGYGTAIMLAGGLLKKSQIYTDWPGLQPQNLFEGRDLLATIDSRSVYCSAMSHCFDLDFERLRRNVFWNVPLTNLSDSLFNV
jgi:uncharacterized protein (DUF1501 family)